jgi:hypothetical protein
MSDFNNRCGYTDSHDRWFGGAITFHIDHFKPHKKFPHLKVEYSNLVYACSYVNILKSDDDPVNYIDPCVEDYNKHFYRDKSGRIFANPSSPRAMYMHKKLKLGLARYELVWQLDRLDELLGKIESLVKTLKSDGEERKNLVYLHFDLAVKFREYLKYLSS